MPITNNSPSAARISPKPSQVTSTTKTTAAGKTATTSDPQKAEKTKAATVATVVASAQTQADSRKVAGAAQSAVAASVNNTDVEAKVAGNGAQWDLPATVAVRRGIAERNTSGTYTAADPQLMEAIKAGQPGALVRGQKSEGVRETQGLLNKFGFGLAEDSMLGPRTEAALKNFQKAAGLPETGQLDAATYQALQNTDPAAIQDKLNLDLPDKLAPITGARLPTGERRQMIVDAILNDPKIPDSWATDESKLAAINRIVEKESGWRVGVPNYTIRQAGLSGDEAARLLQSNRNLTRFGASSSAMGLFQLLGTNMDKYQPGGRAAIGNAQAEMQGGLRYMLDRYGTPERALAFHNRNNWW